MKKNDRKKYKIATLDIETDPFLHGRIPMPFCIGFYDGENYVDFWGDDCIAEMIEYLDSLPDDYRIYVHNGGGFDFWYLQDWITNPLFFISKRIAKCGLLGRHELRDSYKMIPIPLSKFNKEEIDYALFEEHRREKYRKKILHYLFLDCKYLYDMVTQFIDKYGDHLTIGAAAMKHLKKDYPNKSQSQHFDALYRPYYLGGRVECIQRGRIDGPFKLYDVNSLYPYVMRAFSHPLGNEYRLHPRIPDTDNVYFARIIAESKKALPIRLTTTSGFTQGLSFPSGEFEFYAISHELQKARELGLIKIKRVIECREFKESQRFDKYIDRFAAEKIEAEERGDKGGREFAKLFMNNAYGKFGQDPRKYSDCEIFDDIESAEAAGYALCNTFGDRFIGQRPAELKPWSFNNVAIAASITSAARSVLLDGLHHAKNPVYCDTDSIVCESLDRELHQTKLGAWKLEAEGNRIDIAGKKLYAFYSGDKCIKKASKGVNLSPSLISEVATSQIAVPVKIDAPVLRMAKDAKFIERKIRATY